MEAGVAVVKKKGLAIASLVCAIVGGWASPTTLPAVICGHIALSRIKQRPHEFGGSALAMTGLILGYLGLLQAAILGPPVNT
jgi:peptidyl-prolyl cis-trans isomerase B (cyclophilin B)